MKGELEIILYVLKKQKNTRRKTQRKQIYCYGPKLGP